MTPRVSPTLLLAAGVALIFVTFMRYSLPVLGWIVFAPFLAFLHERATRRDHLVVFATVVVGFVAAISKVATEEIHWAPPVPMFAVPMRSRTFWRSLSAAPRRRTLVEIGHQTAQEAEVVDGVTEGAMVIVHPGDLVRDGTRVMATR